MRDAILGDLPVDGLGELLLGGLEECVLIGFAGGHATVGLQELGRGFAEQVGQEFERFVGVLAGREDAERVGIEGGRRLTVVGRRGGHVPVVTGARDAVRGPQVVLAHRDVAGEERVAVRVEVGPDELRTGHRDVVRPDAVVEPLPRFGPSGWDLGRLAVIAGGELAGLPIGADLAQIVALRFEAPLDDALGVERRIRGVLAVLVHGQQLGDLGRRVVVPGDGRTVRHRVRAAPLVRWLREPGFLEQAGLVEQDRRVDRERDADLAFAADVVEADRALRELGHVVLGLVDVGLEVQPLAMERFGAADADRPDDVRPGTGRQLRREGVACAGVGDRPRR